MTLRTRRRGRRKPLRGKTVAGVIALAALGGVVMGGGLAGWPGREPSVGASNGLPQPTAFGSCKWGGGSNCVVDGDTLYLGGTKVRVADIDAPETHDYGCAEELALGSRAAERLRQLVNSGPVTLAPIDRDEDRYGRKLRIVMVAGASVGDTLVAEGLARPYAGGRRPWCA